MLGSLLSIGLLFSSLIAINFLRSAFDLKQISFLDPFYYIRDLLLFKEHKTVYKEDGEKK